VIRFQDDDRRRILCRVFDRFYVAAHPEQTRPGCIQLGEPGVLDECYVRNGVIARERQGKEGLLLLILVMVFAGARNPEPVPTEQLAEVVPLVDQLVPPLIAAPAAPPVAQVALLAA
jgi:hypothetical protein